MSLLTVIIIAVIALGVGYVIALVVVFSVWSDHIRANERKDRDAY